MQKLLIAGFYYWAAAVALFALPYLTLRRHAGLETTEALQWALVAVAAFGTVRVFYVAWQLSRDRAWRASHGFTAPFLTR